MKIGSFTKKWLLAVGMITSFAVTGHAQQDNSGGYSRGDYRKEAEGRAKGYFNRDRDDNNRGYRDGDRDYEDENGSNNNCCKPRCKPKCSKPKCCKPKPCPRPCAEPPKCKQECKPKCEPKCKPDCKPRCNSCETKAVDGTRAKGLASAPEALSALDVKE